MLITSKEEALALKDSLENEMKFMKDEKKKEAVTMNDMRREMSKSEKLYREELIEREKLSEALRNELEKRLEELSSEKKENSTLRTENMKFTKRLEEFDVASKRNEAIFQRTLEQDRSNIQKEMKVKLNRVKKLEDEKISLLQEVEGLISQVTSTKKALKDAEEVTLVLQTKNEETQVELQNTQSRLSEAMREIKSANSRETELKDQVLKLELHFNESTSRLETDLKQNKKAAAQQIIDISAKNKAYENEIEVFRARCADLENDLREAHDALENMKEKITVGEKGINIFIEKIESIDVYSMYAYVQY